jgi:hypothetical protein
MPPRHRFLEPIHNVKDGGRSPDRGRSREPWSSSLETGGASRDRTGDLKLAKLALSQLSYGPVLAELYKLYAREGHAMVGREGVEPSTSRLSGVRSNHLSYRPPCRLTGRWATGAGCQLRCAGADDPRRRFQDEGT